MDRVFREPSVAMQMLHHGYGGKGSSRKAQLLIYTVTFIGDHVLWRKWLKGTRLRIPTAEMRVLERFSFAGTVRDFQGGLSGEARHSLVSKGTHWVSLGLLSGRLLDTVLSVCSFQLDLEWSVAGVEWDLGVHQHQLDQLGEIKVHFYICLSAQTELKLLMHLVF